jgi:hypothetical protein
MFARDRWVEDAFIFANRVGKPMDGAGQRAQTLQEAACESQSF